jgi:hypothetical protein
MTKRPGDETPEPAGGRAAERLRMFEDARQPKSDPEPEKKPKSKSKKERDKKPKG